MKNIFENTAGSWVRYDSYDIRKLKDGHLYVMPSFMSNPSFYNPLKESNALVTDAINLGRICGKEETTEEEKQDLVLDFTLKYGLLGIMTGLVTSPDFTGKEKIYLPKNRYIKEEFMPFTDYVNLFFPYEQEVNKPETDPSEEDTLITDSSSAVMAFVTSGMSDGMQLVYKREYAERLDWMLKFFEDMFFTFTTCFLYYLDYNTLNDARIRLMKKSMYSFGGQTPRYHIELRDEPTLVWEFPSLMLGIQMMVSFMLTDKDSSIKVCKHCGKAFVAKRSNSEFCSPQCKNQYNVYKSRAKGKGNDDSN